jgi:hypothetical protein
VRSKGRLPWSSSTEDTCIGRRQLDPDRGCAQPLDRARYSGRSPVLRRSRQCTAALSEGRCRSSSCTPRTSAACQRAAAALSVAKRGDALRNMAEQEVDQREHARGGEGGKHCSEGAIE